MHLDLLEELRNKTTIDIINYRINKDEFIHYLTRWNYQKFYNKSSTEKAMEHFVSMKLLDFEKKDVFVDIASSNSSFPKIVEETYGCMVYKQDLWYPQGINGQVVGGDACALPFPDHSLTKMTLHCSFEHFEGNADIRFIIEADRVLKEGGKLCIIPLYLSEEYFNLTDPTVDRTGLVFDNGAEIREAVGFENRFARHYNIEQLKERIFNNCNVLKPVIYFLENEKILDDSCYLKYILLLEKNLKDYLQLKRLLKAKDDEIKQKDDEIKQKDDEIKQKDDEIKQKDDEIKQKDDGIKQKDDEIKRLLNSRSWKITAPFRSLFRLFKMLRH